VSLTLNLAVLGAIAGAHVRDGADARRLPPPERSALRDVGIGPFLDAMPREDRAALGAAMRERVGGDIGPDREALANDFQEMLAALRAEPYDSDRLDAVLTAQHDRMESRILAGQAVLIEAIAKMSPTERQAYADRLEAGMRMSGPGEGGNGGPGNGMGNGMGNGGPGNGPGTPAPAPASPL